MFYTCTEIDSCFCVFSFGLGSLYDLPFLLVNDSFAVHHYNQANANAYTQNAEPNKTKKKK